MTVRAITLFESRLSPRGPQYRVIQRTRLGGE
jgi:2'-5' RNA ligase